MLSKHTQQVIKRRKQAKNSRKIIKWFTIIAIILFIGVLFATITEISRNDLQYEISTNDSINK